MANPLVARAKYNKRPLMMRGESVVDPDKLTRELGLIEGALGFATSFVGTVFNVLDYGVDPRGAADSTTALQNLLNAVGEGDAIYLPPNIHLIVSDTLTCRAANVTVYGMGRSSLIEQLTPDTPVFSATSLANLTFANFRVLGPGVWSAAWTGNEGHEERGIQLINCPDLWIDRVRTQNFGHSGIALRGTCSGTVLNCTTVGTDTVPSNGNFQMGLYVTYGPASEAWGALRVIGHETSATAQGILLERGTAAGTGEVLIAHPYLHDIPGQHGIYCQSGNVTVVGGVMRDCDLSAVKIQTGLSSTEDLANVVVSGVNAENCRGNAFEVAGLDDTYSIRNVSITGCAARGSDRILSAVGLIDGLTVEVRGGDTEGHGVFLGDSGALVPKNVSIAIEADTIDRNGVYVSSDGATNIRLSPNLTNVGQETANTYSGVLVEGDTEGVRIFNPRLVNDTGSMNYGIFQSDAAAGYVKVYGETEIAGAATADIRGNNALAWGPVQNTRTITTTDTVTYDDETILVDATGGNVTVNLLPASYLMDRQLNIKKIDASANTVTVDASGSETIDDATTAVLAVQYESVSPQSDGTEWWIT